MLDKLKHISGLLRSLSFTRNLQLFLLVVTILLGIGLFENRQAVYSSLNIQRTEAVGKPVDIRLGKVNREKVNQFVKRSDIVIAFQVIETDFAKNTRKTSHFEIDNPILYDIYTDYLINKVSDLPLFGSTEEHNKRMVKLINGQFVCSPITDTVGPRIFKGIENVAPYICSVSVPPVYGYFSGYISVYLNRKPTDGEVDSLKQTMFEIAQSIYDLDIKK